MDNTTESVMSETFKNPAPGNEPRAKVVQATSGKADPIDDVSGPAGDCGTPGATCGGPKKPSYVYVIGKIGARFPNPGIEKEVAQAIGRTESKGKTDQQSFHSALSRPEHRYLVRQLCWVLTVQEVETYLLVPRDPADVDLLVQAIRPTPNPSDVDVVIGLRGPIAPPEMCNGLMLPIVGFDQIYSFDRESLFKAIPRPDNIAADKFSAVAAEVFDRIMQLTDNAGNADDHRALNYLAMRYPAIYANAADAFARDFALSGVEVRPGRISGARNHLDVIFSQTNRRTDFTEKWSVRVDVTDEFPFLVTKLAPYFDR
jgi:hypothetical protein